MDRNFDDIADRFQRNIYSSPKGAIRLAVILDDLLRVIPALGQGAGMRILDAGVGMGQVSLELARCGHALVACDISIRMLDQARALLSREVPDARIEYIHTAVQDLPAAMDQSFDLVLFHAVLEWVAEPEQTLQRVLDFIKPGGYLSLMFYNRHSVVLRNVLRGNFRKVKSGQFQGDPKSLTPTHPLDPEQVYAWLDNAGMRIESRSGIRMFYDYMTRELREQRSLEDIIEMEKMFAQKEPFLSMARYIHIIATKPSA